MNTVQNLENHNLLDIVELNNAFSTDCKYINLSDDSTHLDVLDSFKIGHVNIHSIPNKFDDLIDILNNMQCKHILPDILLICETFLNENNYDKFQFPNYNIISEYRKAKSKGGVSILVQTQIRYLMRSDLSIFEEGKFESIFIEIPQNCGSNIIIGEIYRVPGTSEVDFMNYYESIVNKIRGERKKIIIGTDQNMDYLKIKTHRNTQKFFELNLTNNLLPIIFKPTRVTHTSATLIDNIYVDTEICANVSSYILTTDISDHFFCLALIHGFKANGPVTGIQQEKLMKL